MTPTEFWHLYEARRPRKRFGQLTEDDVDDLTAMLDKALEDKSNGITTPAS